jgi:DNA-binding NarL/FixJ family response regulator
VTEFSQNLPLPSAPVVAERIRVALIISSKLERLGWSIVLESQPDIEIVGQFSSWTAALALLEQETVDVALIDEAILTPKACERLLARPQTHSGPRFLMMARHLIDPAVAESRYAFVSCHLLKGLSAADLLAAIRNTEI